jgi:predicted transcriptional regulator
MKSVLISIRPKWCELIASGQKTIEVRKTRPKLETPFKCYIYQTVESKRAFNDHRFHSVSAGKCCTGDTGKVIGEFVCDSISTICEPVDGIVHFDDGKSACLSVREIIEYGNGNTVYGWHIFDLKIYDRPRELNEFKKIKRDCWYAHLGLAKRDCPECQNEGCFVHHPPQNWCYVEDSEAE